MTVLPSQPHRVVSYSAFSRMSRNVKLKARGLSRVRFSAWGAERRGEAVMRSEPADGSRRRSPAFRAGDEGAAPHLSEPVEPLLRSLRWSGLCCAALLAAAIALAVGAAIGNGAP